jgi:NADPH:quinone reductase-like Zn-dependent oxidoreductase
LNDLQPKKAIIGAAGLRSYSEKRSNVLALAKELIEAGHISPVIDGCYLWEQIAEAHRYVDTGHTKDTIVITWSRTTNNKWVLPKGT